VLDRPGKTSRLARIPHSGQVRQRLKIYASVEAALELNAMTLSFGNRYFSCREDRQKFRCVPYGEFRIAETDCNNAEIAAAN
jgi:hypothetical protein